MPPGRPSAPVAAIVALAIAFAALGLGAAESTLPARRAGGGWAIPARALAEAAGGYLREGGDALTVHGADGALITVFAGSSQATVAGGEALTRSVPLSAPVTRDAEGWWLPPDAAVWLGFAWAGEGRLRGPDGQVYELTAPQAPAPRDTPPFAERVTLGGGVAAVRLFAPSADGTDDGLALLLADLELLALADPAQRAALDAAAARWEGRRALALLATARRPAALPLDELVIRQDGREVRARGERLATLAGDPGAVGPEAPWWGVLWLPRDVRVDQPLRLHWRGGELEVQFRR